MTAIRSVQTAELPVDLLKPAGRAAEGQLQLKTHAVKYEEMVYDITLSQLTETTATQQAEMAALPDVLLKLDGRALEAQLQQRIHAVRFEVTENDLIACQLTETTVIKSVETAVALLAVLSQAGIVMAAPH